MTSASRKLQFALDIDDDWPPVSSESVWCDQVGMDFRLRSAPFFIKGLAVNDTFQAEPDAVNGHIFEFVVVESSGHSLIWILKNRQADIDSLLAQFRGLGCSTEGFETFSLYSIDIPPNVADLPLIDLLDTAEKAGLDLAFPVWRREGNQT